MDIFQIISNRITLDSIMQESAVKSLQANMLRSEWVEKNGAVRTLTSELSSLQAKANQPGIPLLVRAAIQKKIDALTLQTNAITEQMPKLDRAIFAANYDLSFLDGWKQDAQRRLDRAFQTQQQG